MKGQKTMEINVYSIKDVKMGFTAIYTLPNNASAIRWFGDMVVNKDTPMSKHPEDYQLFKIGVMDDQTGEFKSEVQFLENASAYSQS